MYKMLEETEELLSLSGLFPKELRESIELGINKTDYDKAISIVKKLYDEDYKFMLFMNICIYTDIRLGRTKLLNNGEFEFSLNSYVFSTGVQRELYAKNISENRYYIKDCFMEE